MQGYKLEQLGKPTQADDLATKKYVDDEAAKRLTKSQGDTRYLKKGGDAMGGSLSMGNNRITTLGSPTDDLDGVNRGWVKKRFLKQGTADRRYLAKDGGAMTDNLIMQNNKIIGLADPTGLAGAATKRYVDDKFFPKNGGALGGVLNMGHNRITNLPKATSTEDATSVAG